MEQYLSFEKFKLDNKVVVGLDTNNKIVVDGITAGVADGNV